jgi:hypothetical protein
MISCIIKKKFACIDNLSKENDYYQGLANLKPARKRKHVLTSRKTGMRGARGWLNHGRDYSSCDREEYVS